MLAVFYSECVFLSQCVDLTVHTVLVKETVWIVAEGEMDGLEDQCMGCEGEVVKERRGGRRECLNMQPLWVHGQ